MPTLTLNRLRYYYEVSGSGEPLVLLHGFTGSTENWSDLIDRFGQQFKVIAVDLPGHGKTDSPTDSDRYNMALCAADLEAMFQELRFGPVNLLGYSMGGRLALYLAINHAATVKRLILESASPGLMTAAERRERVANDEKLADDIERTGVDSFVNQWEKHPIFASQAQLPWEVKENLRRQRLKNNPSGLANSLRGMGTGAQPALWQCLPRLRTPLLLIVGQLDRKFVKIGKQIAAAVPSAQLQIVPQAGHTIHLERPGAFAQCVLNYLTDREVMK